MYKNIKNMKNYEKTTTNTTKKKKNNLNNYREWLENQNLSPVTIRGYTNGIRHYGENNDLNDKNINKFFKSKVGKLATNSLISHFTALKSYAEFRKTADIN
jgi:hypothetical protein